MKQWIESNNVLSGSVLYISVGGLSSGILVRSFWYIDLSLLVICGVCVVLGATVAYIASRVSRDALVGIVTGCLCVVSGIWVCDARSVHFETTIDAYASLEGTKVVFAGVIVRDVEDREGISVLVVREVGGGTLPRETLIRVTTSARGPFAYGDTVAVSGTLKRPVAFTTDTARTFLYAEYLEVQGITHIISFASVHTEQVGGFSVFRALYAAKKYFTEHLSLVLSEPQAGLAAGLLLGEKRALGTTLEDVFRTVGIVHIIVLSGYNLTIVAESIMRLLSFAFLPRTRTTIGVVSICIFACMVGLSATVIRASIMGILVLVARVTGRTSSALRGLAFAAFCMLLLNPYVLLYDPGFQLSFLATLGLIVVSPCVENFAQWIPHHFQLREYVVSTTATQIFVTPFLLYAMGNVSLVALLSNVLILCVVPLAMLLSLLAGLASMVSGSVAVYVGFPAYLLLSYMIAIAEKLARVPFASLEVAPFSFWYVVCAYAFLGVLLVWYTRYTNARTL